MEQFDLNALIETILPKLKGRYPVTFKPRPINLAKGNPKSVEAKITKEALHAMTTGDTVIQTYDLGSELHILFNGVSEIIVEPWTIRSID